MIGRIFLLICLFFGIDVNAQYATSDSLDVEIERGQTDVEVPQVLVGRWKELLRLSSKVTNEELGIKDGVIELSLDGSFSKDWARVYNYDLYGEKGSAMCRFRKNGFLDKIEIKDNKYVLKFIIEQSDLLGNQSSLNCSMVAQWSNYFISKNGNNPYEWEFEIINDDTLLSTHGPGPGNSAIFIRIKD